MSKTFILFTAALMAFNMAAQLPQFSSDEFDGWTYSNPNVPLTDSNIGTGKIVLYYVNSTGIALTLTSPIFSCQGIDSIEADVTWFTRNFSDNTFDLEKASLTLVLDDGDGMPLDSVTCTPTTPGVSTHHLTFTLPVPAGLNQARLRFVSWTGNVVSSGAIKQAHFTAVGGSGPTIIPGDANGDGNADIADVAFVIDFLLTDNATGLNQAAADADHDGSISIADVALLIDILLTS